MKGVEEWVTSRFGPGREWATSDPGDPRLEVEAVPAPARPHEHVVLRYTGEDAATEWHITPREMVALCATVSDVCAATPPGLDGPMTRTALVNENGACVEVEAVVRRGKMLMAMYKDGDRRCEMQLDEGTAEWLCQPHLNIGRSLRPANAHT
jgi:hypothetical protein